MTTLPAIPHAFTDEEKARKKADFLVAYKANRRAMGKSAAAVGVNRATVWRWQQEDDEFFHACQEVVADVLEEVEEKVFANAIEGNDLKAQIFVLSRLNRNQWGDKPAEDGTGNVTVVSSIPRPQRLDELEERAPAMIDVPSRVVDERPA